MLYFPLSVTELIYVTDRDTNVCLSTRTVMWLFSHRRTCTRTLYSGLCHSCNIIYLNHQQCMHVCSIRIRIFRARSRFICAPHIYSCKPLCTCYYPPLFPTDQVALREEGLEQTSRVFFTQSSLRISNEHSETSAPSANFRGLMDPVSIVV